MPFCFGSLGEQTLKGFEQPVRAFTANLKDGESIPAPDPTLQGTRSDLHSQDNLSEDRQTLVAQKPSLAVLPFNTVGHSPETEDLADGIAHVVINTMLRIGQTDIVDTATAFAYKGHSVTPTEVAQALGVQYVLQGNVQKFGSRIRITAELFDVESSSNLWSERYDLQFVDPFQLQDEIAQLITRAVRTCIVWGAESAQWEFPNESFDAWILNLQGVELIFARGGAENMRQAHALYEEVMALDPNYPYGPTNGAWTHVYDCMHGWSDSPEKSLEKALMLAQRTFEIDEADAFAYKYGVLGVVLLLRGEYEQALEMADESISRLPHEPSMMGMATGWIHCVSGNYEYGKGLVEQATRLLKHPSWIISENLGTCHLSCGQPQEALAVFEQTEALAGDPAFPHALKAVAYVELDEPDRAHSEMKQALKYRPELTLRHFHYYLAFRDPARREHFSRTLMQAGLPE